MNSLVLPFVSRIDEHHTLMTFFLHFLTASSSPIANCPAGALQLVRRTLLIMILPMLMLHMLLYI